MKTFPNYCGDGDYKRGKMFQLKKLQETLKQKRLSLHIRRVIPLNLEQGELTTWHKLAQGIKYSITEQH